MAAVKFLTMIEAAERLSVSRRTVYELIFEGKLAAISVGCGKKRQSLRIAEDEIAAFIERQRVVVKPAPAPPPRQAGQRKPRAASQPAKPRLTTAGPNPHGLTDDEIRANYPALASLLRR